MTLLSYNICEGGRSKDIDRADVLLDVIRSADPAIVGLCECSGLWDDNSARLKLFESQLGMSAVANHATSGSHIALFSAPSVSIISTGGDSTMMYHGFVRLVISHPKYGRLSIVMTHLHPFSTVLRLAEAETVLANATFE